MTSQEAHDRAKERLPRFVPVINDICATWKGSQHRSVWWDRYNHMFAADKRSQTLSDVLGPTTIRAGRQLWRATQEAGVSGVLRRWDGPYDFGLRIPEDAIVIRPFMGRGPLLASASNKSVLKTLVRRRNGTCKLDNEIAALKIGMAAGLSASMPEIEADGESEEGVRWMVNELVPNLRPFVKSFPSLLRSQWNRFLRDECLPFLADFYRASGISSRSIENIENDILAQCEVSRLSDLLLPTVNAVIGARPARDVPPIYEAVVHGDLSPAHIHRSTTSWKLIDWGESRRRAISYELFRGPWDQPKSTHPVAASFWAWILGERSSQLHPEMVRRLELAKSVVKNASAESLGDDELRHQIQILNLSESVAVVLKSDESEVRKVMGDTSIVRARNESFSVAVHKLSALSKIRIS